MYPYLQHFKPHLAECDVTLLLLYLSVLVAFPTWNVMFQVLQREMDTVPFKKKKKTSTQCCHLCTSILHSKV